jgi:hypothetical protein
MDNGVLLREYDESAFLLLLGRLVFFLSVLIASESWSMSSLSPTEQKSCERFGPGPWGSVPVGGRAGTAGVVLRALGGR